MRKLSCEEAVPLLEAFQDNELEGVTSLAVQEHVEQCPRCAQRLRWNAEAGASLLRLAEGTPSASPAFRARMLAIGGAGPHTIAARFRQRVLAMAAGIVLLLGIGSVIYLRNAEARDVMRFVENHTARLEQVSAVEFQTADAAEAEEWLRLRLPFTPVVPRPAGYRLLGARPCHIENRPVAFLLYEHEGRQISCFVSADSQRRLRGFDATAANRVRLGTCEGKNVAAWDADHSGYVLVGDVPREALVAFASQSAAEIRDGKDN
jgi:anti-sigma factor RsiW